VGGGNDLQVVSGTLHFDSATHPESSITVEPGMCLVEVESEVEPSSLTAALAAGVCE
jgi:hypothetical protein